MKFIRQLFTRKASKELLPVTPAGDRNARQSDLASGARDVQAQASNLKAVAAEDVNRSADDILLRINAQVEGKPVQVVEDEPVNIWDIDGGGAPEAVEAAPRRQRRRNQTRLLGFEHVEDDDPSAFDSAEKLAPAPRNQFPVGWVLVSEGPGRGECFTLQAGMSQIGRAEDQSIQLDFGDNSISRVNHAAVVYDPDTHEFILGHGGKKNIVRLNDKPVISNEEIHTGDKIRIGETTLHFVALCSKEFNWADQDNENEENDDVAIA